MVVYDPSTGVSFAVIKESSICDDANENNETKTKMKKTTVVVVVALLSMLFLLVS